MKFCSSLETLQKNELDNERQTNTEQLSSLPNDNRLATSNHSQNIHSTTLLLFSDSMIEGYQNKIEQLEKNLFEKDNETNSLTQRLNELELELQRAIDDHTSKSNKYEENLQSTIEQ